MRVTKKALGALLCASLATGTFATSNVDSNAAENHSRNISIYVDGRMIPQPDQKAFIKDGRTMVPLRTVMEGLNMNVQWDGAERKIVIQDAAKGLYYTFYADKAYFEIYNEGDITKKTLDVAPYVTANNRTVMPLRAIAETYGKVQWDNALSRVTISGSGASTKTPNVKPIAPVKPVASEKSVTPKMVEHEKWPATPSQPSTNSNTTKLPKGVELEYPNGDRPVEKPVARKGKHETFLDILEADAQGATADSFTLAVLEETNKFRAENGLKPLKLSPILCKAATIRAKEFATMPNFVNVEAVLEWEKAVGNPHQRPNGERAKTVLNDLGYNEYFNFIGFGENLMFKEHHSPTYLNQDAKDLVDGWANSPGHRANMLNPTWKYFGFAAYDGLGISDAFQHFAG